MQQNPRAEAFLYQRFTHMPLSKTLTLTRQSQETPEYCAYQPMNWKNARSKATEKATREAIITACIGCYCQRGLFRVSPAACLKLILEAIRSKADL